MHDAGPIRELHGHFCGLEDLNSFRFLKIDTIPAHLHIAPIFNGLRKSPPSKPFPFNRLSNFGRGGGSILRSQRQMFGLSGERCHSPARWLLPQIWELRALLHGMYIEARFRRLTTQDEPGLNS